MDVLEDYKYKAAIEDICEMNWAGLSQDDLTDAAWAYYFFSIQFRENLQIARKLHSDDQNLMRLEQEECNTANLSPWPGVAEPREAMNHDEFMRRTLLLSPISGERTSELKKIGEAYLAITRGMDATTSALSIASYEDGGLEQVFHAFLQAPDWDTPLLQAFKHFLTEHIKFDSDPTQGHGALSRHLAPDDRILPLWTAFRQLLVESVPNLAHNA